MNIANDSELLKKNIYSVEKNEWGHTIILFDSLESIKPTKIFKESLINHIIDEVANALAISKQFNKTRSYVHLYTNGKVPSNFSISFYKKLITRLSDTYIDTLEAAYIYDAPAVASGLWDVIKLFIDSTIRKKIHMTNSHLNA